MAKVNRIKLQVGKDNIDLNVSIEELDRIIISLQEQRALIEKKYALEAKKELKEVILRNKYLSKLIEVDDYDCRVINLEDIL